MPLLHQGILEDFLNAEPQTAKSQVRGVKEFAQGHTSWQTGELRSKFKEVTPKPVFLPTVETLPNKWRR